jgi:hypothetical protein
MLKNVNIFGLILLRWRRWRHGGRQRGAAEETRGCSGAWWAQRKLEVAAWVHGRGKVGEREGEARVSSGIQGLLVVARISNIRSSFAKILTEEI